MNNIEADKKIRAQALNPSESFIVQAPAGSGKTELLIQRYLRLLACVEKAPEEVVAITFTRKAAGEMRERVMEALSLADEPAPELDHKRTTWELAKAVANANTKQGWHLEKNPNRLRIMTIDALSAMLNAQIPLLSGFGANVDIIDEPESLYRLAVERLLRHLKKQNTTQYNALSTLLLHFENNAEQLAELLQDLLSKREQWLPHIIAHYRNRDWLRAELEKSLSHIAEEAISKIESHFPDCYLEKAIELLVFSSEIQTFDYSLEHWQALASLFLTQTGTWRKTVNKRSGFPAKSPEKEQMLTLLKAFEENEMLLATLKQTRSCPPRQYNKKQWGIVDALLEILPLLTAELTILFQEHGAIDFTEQTLGALRAMGDEEHPTELAMHLDYQIRHILIDEFQDTSVIQFHLIENLVREWQPDDGRTLFIVGDPMQSIYRFRQAEVGLFLRLQQQPIQQILLTPLTLKCNFRSETGIVDWINHTFDSVFPKEANISEGGVPYENAVAIHSNSTDNNVFFYNHNDSDSQNQANTLTQTITQIKDKHPKDTIAILVRSRSHLTEIIKSFRNKQLAFHAVDIEPLAQYPEIQDLLSLAKALLHLNDHVAWLSVLRSPFCGLTLTDLHRLTLNDEALPIWWTLKNNKNSDHLSADARDRLTQLISVFSQSFAEQAQLSLSNWIEKTWLNLGGANTLKDQKSLQHTEAFFDLLRKVQTDFSLPDFIKRIEKLFAKTANETNVPVQILTIHKSKGLEFDHVFLPHLEKKDHHESPRLLQWLERVSMHETSDLVLAPIKSKRSADDKIYQYLREMEKKKLEYERARLLYVACTRAKKTLHLSAITHETESTHSFLGLLLKTAKAEFSLKLIPNQSLESSSTFELPSGLTRLADPSLIGSLNTRELTEPFSANNFIQRTSKENLYARITGTVIHEALQLISDKKLTTTNTFIKTKLMQLGIPAHQVEQQTRMAKQAIANIQSSQRGQWIIGSHVSAHSEYPLSTLISGKLKTFIIDRTFIDEKGTRWIIDYKTSQPENQSLNEFLATEKQKYLAQLSEYAKLFSRLEGRRIELGLYFPLCDGWTSWKFKETTCLANASH